MSDELSDALHNMAEEPADQRRRAAAREEDADPAPGELTELENEGDAAPVARSTTPVRRKSSAHARFRIAALPVLILVGLALGAVGTWGVAVLAGMDVVLSDRPDAERMARAMALVCFPLALALLAGAGYFIYQIRRRR